MSKTPGQMIGELREACDAYAVHRSQDRRARVEKAEKSAVRHMTRDHARIAELEGDMRRIYAEVQALADACSHEKYRGRINAIGDFAAHAMKKGCYAPRTRSRSPVYIVDDPGPSSNGRAREGADE